MSAAENNNDWLPGPLEDGVEIPLSLVELTELYGSNLTLTEDEIAELSQPLPYLGDLLTLEQFTRLLQEGEVLKQWNDESEASTQNQSWQDRQLVHDRTLAAVEDLCGHSSAAVVMNLRCAIRAKSPSQYEQALEHLAALTKKTRAYRTRNALLVKLEQAAPKWAAAIRNREGVHAGGEIPGDAGDAWRWRQDQQSPVDGQDGRFKLSLGNSAATHGRLNATVAEDLRCGAASRQARKMFAHASDAVCVEGTTKR